LRSRQTFVAVFFLLNTAKQKHSDKDQETASYEVARRIVAMAGKRIPPVHNYRETRDSKEHNQGPHNLLIQEKKFVVMERRSLMP